MAGALPGNQGQLRGTPSSSDGVYVGSAYTDRIPLIRSRCVLGRMISPAMRDRDLNIVLSKRFGFEIDNLEVGVLLGVCMPASVSLDCLPDIADAPLIA